MPAYNEVDEDHGADTRATPARSVTADAHPRSPSTGQRTEAGRGISGRNGVGAYGADLTVDARAGGSVISQALLKDLVQVRRKQRELELHARGLREQLLVRLNQGAGIEPGRFRPRVHTREGPQLTRANLAALVGEDQCRALMSRLPVTKIQLIYIDEYQS
jgi:hypothetical protein